MDIKAVFGHHLRQIREERSLTQEDLGHQAGLSTSYISEIERGNRNLTLDKLVRLAMVLRVPLPALLTIPELVTTPLEKLYGRISECSPRKQEAIVKALEAMLD